MHHRTHPETLTVAYIAMGAAETFDAETMTSRVIDDFNGQIGLMDAIIYPAMLLDRVADYFDEHEGHPGVFQYEVSEPFGAAYARTLMIEDRFSTPDPAVILRDIMERAGYVKDELDKAFAHAAEAAR